MRLRARRRPACRASLSHGLDHRQDAIAEEPAREPLQVADEPLAGALGGLALLVLADVPQVVRERAARLRGLGQRRPGLRRLLFRRQAAAALLALLPQLQPPRQDTIFDDTRE